MSRRGKDGVAMGIWFEGVVEEGVGVLPVMVEIGLQTWGSRDAAGTAVESAAASSTTAGWAVMRRSAEARERRSEAGSASERMVVYVGRRDLRYTSNRSELSRET